MTPLDTRNMVFIGCQVSFVLLSCHVNWAKTHCIAYIKPKIQPPVDIVMLHFHSDNEYLHKSKEGHIFIHHVETKDVSPFLTNKTFVSIFSLCLLACAILLCV